MLEPHTPKACGLTSHLQTLGPSGAHPARTGLVLAVPSPTCKVGILIFLSMATARPHEGLADTALSAVLPSGNPIGRQQRQLQAHGSHRVTPRAALAVQLVHRAHHATCHMPSQCYACMPMVVCMHANAAASQFKSALTKCRP